MSRNHRYPHKAPIAARLTDQTTGAGVANQTITFSAGNEGLCSGVTDANGVATCGTPVDAVNTLQSYGYTALFAGSEEFELSSAHGDALIVNGTVIR
ncbi:MAG TPA: hypothetical protein VMY34_02295 [Acidimicrobiales bacterium]|nr:hypothetical protein [Acidimicrobiales bacterium]